MLIFFVVTGLLVLLALGFIVPVLFKNNQLEPEQFDEQNIQIAKDRLKELKQELEAGSISQQEFETTRQELENNLALDLSAGEQAAASANSGASKNLAYVLMIVVPVLAAAIYSQLGTFDAVTGEVATVAENMSQPPDMTMEEAINGLKARLQQEPNNPEGWFMLAKTYVAIQQYADAVTAYEKTLELVGDNANLLLRYADALIMSQGGRITDDVNKAVTTAMELEPDNMQGLWMAGMVASSQANYKQALNYWYRLDAMLNNDINSQTQLREQIAAAEKNLSADSIDAIKRTAGTTAPSQVAEVKAEITVDVSVDESLKDRLSETDTLFVFAKAMQGPPMPLAAVKHPVSVLPVTVKLNDAMAMMPNMKLSNFDQVKVSAVISKSGQPGVATGDLYVELESISVKNTQQLSLVINKIKE